MLMLYECDVNAIELSLHLLPFFYLALISRAKLESIT